jgi:hypothetical protein
MAGPLSVGIPNANGGDPSSQKPATPGMPTGGGPLVRTTAATPGEATGGSGIDGSVAYRQFQQSDNPYDPKFNRDAIGVATVGPVTEVKDGAPKAKSDEPEPAQQDH